MISTITGILKSKSPTEAIVDVNDIGFSVNIPLSTYEKLGDAGTRVSLFVHLYVREDVIQLFGFISEEERSLFRMLISVTGIGPKIAQSILSGISIEELKSHVLNKNIEALTSIPGVGRKTAERIILELRDKIAKIPMGGEPILGDTELQVAKRNEALQALISLGYNQQIAEKAIRLVLKECKTSEISIEELIKRALRFTFTIK